VSGRCRDQQHDQQAYKRALAIGGHRRSDAKDGYLDYDVGDSHPRLDDSFDRGDDEGDRRPDTDRHDGDQGPNDLGEGEAVHSRP